MDKTYTLDKDRATIEKDKAEYYMKHIGMSLYNEDEDMAKIIIDAMIRDKDISPQTFVAIMVKYYF